MRKFIPKNRSKHNIPVLWEILNLSRIIKSCETLRPTFIDTPERKKLSKIKMDSKLWIYNSFIFFVKCMVSSSVIFPHIGESPKIVIVFEILTFLTSLSLSLNNFITIKKEYPQIVCLFQYRKILKTKYHCTFCAKEVLFKNCQYVSD